MSQDGSSTDRLRALSGIWEPCGKLGTGGPGKVTISGDGKVVAFLFYEGMVAIHRIADQELIGEVANTSGPPPPDFDPNIEILHPLDDFWESRSIALSFDGSIVVVTDRFHVAGWRVADGTKLFDVPGYYTQIALSPDRDKFLAKSAGTLVYLSALDLRMVDGGALIRGFPPGNLTSGFSDDGMSIQSYMAIPPNVPGEASTPAVVKVKADMNGDLISTATIGKTFDDLMDNGAVFSPKGTYLAGFGWTDSSRSTNVLRVFRTSDGESIFTLETPFQLELTFSPDETMLLGFTHDNITGPDVLIDLVNGSTRTIVTDAIGSRALGIEGKPLFIVDLSGVYWIGDPWLDNQPIRFSTLPGQGLSFMSLTVSPDGQRLISSSIEAPVDRTTVRPEDLNIWDLPARRIERTVSGIAASSVAFSPDGRRFIAVTPYDPDKTFREWTVDSDEPTWTLPAGDVGTLWTAAYDPAGTAVALGVTDGVKVVPVGTGELSATMPTGALLPGLAFSPQDNGRTLATSGPVLWRVAESKRIWPADVYVEPTLHPDFFDNWVTFSPDGTIVLVSDFGEYHPPPWPGTSGGSPGKYDIVSTRLFNAGDGTLLEYLGSALPRRPAFSPDGRWIVAGDKLWNLASAKGNPLPLSPRWKNPSVSTFAPDGTIFVGREDGVIEIFCPK